jgi:long-chain acyl-CoA synthetase
MLSHNNILSNVAACLSVLTPRPEDVFLSFLPLSHTFERTCGYYLAVMTGAATAYSRSIPQLAEDLQAIRPTLLISVPRIYERVFSAIRARLAEGPAFRKKLFDLAIEVGCARFEHAQGRHPWRWLLKRSVPGWVGVCARQFPVARRCRRRSRAFSSALA